VYVRVCKQLLWCCVVLVTFMQRRPMLSGWKPSTSFSTEMADSTSCSSICFGNCNDTQTVFMSIVPGGMVRHGATQIRYSRSAC